MVTLQEARDEIVSRLAVVKPDLSQLELLQEADRAMKNIQSIQKLPELHEIAVMSHQKLLNALNECPESPLFAN